jgi:hypothetical protein
MPAPPEVFSDSAYYGYYVDTAKTVIIPMKKFKASTI